LEKATETMEPAQFSVLRPGKPIEFDVIIPDPPARSVKRIQVSNAGPGVPIIVTQPSPWGPEPPAGSGEVFSLDIPFYRIRPHLMRTDVA
jgi:hypothetical protein